jgi:hypothetical protein
MFVQLLKELTDEIQILEFTVVSLDKTPMGDTVISYIGYKRKAFSF